MRKAFGLLVAVLCATLFADESVNTARVRIRTAKGVEMRRVPLVRTGENAARFTFRRADLPQGAKWLDVVPDFMTARRGEEGYWIQGRGLYGTFDKPAGTNVWRRQQMPIYGMKRGDRLAWAHGRMCGRTASTTT